MARGWTWIDEDKANEALVPAIEALLSAWNVQNNMVDRQYRHRNNEGENEKFCEWLDERAADIVHQMLEEQYGDETHDWKKFHRKEVQQMENEQYNLLAANDKQEFSDELKKLDSLERGMHALGARLMRPYEHWNEEERYMEYMETRHDNDDSYSMY